MIKILWYEKLSDKLGNRLHPRALRLAVGLLFFWVVTIFGTILVGNWLIVRNFLLFNIFLSVLPFVFSLLLASRESRKKGGILDIVFWLAWLVTYPNAPYMLTDFIHVREYTYQGGYDPMPAVSSWLGLVQIVAAVAVGCTFGSLSLYLLHMLVRRKAGVLAGWVFTGAIAGASGVAIYIGRFMRFNSWDIARRPVALLLEIMERLGQRTAWLCLLFAGMTFGAYLLFYFCFDGKENAELPAKAPVPMQGQEA